MIRRLSKLLGLFGVGAAIAAACMSCSAWASAEEEVHARFEQWIVAFNSNDADKLAILYDQNARLFSTLGNEKPLDRRDSIRAYFTAAFRPGPGSVAFDHDDAVKVIGASAAIETGYYHFDITSPDGQRRTLVSRYTFAFEKKDGVDNCSPPLIASSGPDDSNDRSMSDSLNA
jgi:uncharacterized protein (TIGR02246 family)